MLYPVYLKLQNKTVLVIGGSEIAERKIKQLKPAKAKIICISKNISIRIQKIKGIKIIKKEFIKKYIMEFSPVLIINASGDNTIDRDLMNIIQKKNIFYNSVDVPEYCNFYVPAIIKEKDLLIAFSTQGKSPFMTGYIKRKIQEYIKPEWIQWIDLFSHMRKELKKSSFNYKEKLNIYNQIIRNKKVKSLIKSGNKTQAVKEAKLFIKSIPANI